MTKQQNQRLEALFARCRELRYRRPRVMIDRLIEQLELFTSCRLWDLNDCQNHDETQEVAAGRLWGDILKDLPQCAREFAVRFSLREMCTMTEADTLRHGAGRRILLVLREALNEHGLKFGMTHSELDKEFDELLVP